jgi:inner membrane transporter RhtA
MQTTSVRPAAAGTPPIPAPDPVRGTSQWAGPAMMFGSALSNQLGAATGVLAFPVIGPVGVVAVRQWIAGIALLATGRPHWRSFTWAQWWPVLLLAAVVALTRPRPSTDYAGIGLALLAAACWAGYILLNRLIGARLPGAQGSADGPGPVAAVDRLGEHRRHRRRQRRHLGPPGQHRQRRAGDPARGSPAR